MVKGWGSERFLRCKDFYEVKRVGHEPKRPKVCVIEYVLASSFMNCRERERERGGERGRGGHTPAGPKVYATECVLS